jgi:hypothetical protein
MRRLSSTRIPRSPSTSAVSRDRFSWAIQQAVTRTLRRRNSLVPTNDGWQLFTAPTAHTFDRRLGPRANREEPIDDRREVLGADVSTYRYARRAAATTQAPILCTARTGVLPALRRLPGPPVPPPHPPPLRVLTERQKLDTRAFQRASHRLDRARPRIDDALLQPYDRVQRMVQRRGNSGVPAGALGCVFGALGILTLGVVFVPLGALCSGAGLLRALIGRSGPGIGVSLIGGILTIAGFLFSPSFWFLFGGLLVASQVHGSTTSATNTAWHRS